MLALEVVVVLAAAILVSTLLAQRLRIAPPILLLACGALLGFVPALAQVQLPPEAVLLVFLPALLYWESITTSLREIRSNLRGVALMSTLLVFATAAAVASIAHLFGVPWGPAWVLGAAVAPTDATAVGALTRSLPRSDVTSLRAESLVNDGSALVLYGIAVSATVGEMQVGALSIGGSLVLSYGGGFLAGCLVAAIAVWARPRLKNAMIENVAILLTPFTAFLLAELIHASGVLAVVTAGLIMSQAGPRVGKAAARQQTESFWSLATFLLNGSLFVLVGIQLQGVVQDLTGASLGLGLALVAVVSVCLVVVRLAFLFITAYTIRALDRRPSQRRRRMSNRSRVVSGLAGFRGAVSLAAALAVPATMADGTPFPDRSLIIFVTAGVIVVTIVGQGLTLPAVVRWAKLPKDTSVSEERLFAETTFYKAALADLPEIARRLGTDAEVTERLRTEYEEHLEELDAETRAFEKDDRPDAPGDTSKNAEPAAVRRRRQMVELRLALLRHKRATMIELRDEKRIDDIVLRQLQDRLDIEEVRLTGRAPVE
ncbi:Na+/H+ antiporter [Microbacterium sp. P04]|uniref:Na+/H+ antiporter n=1 Tax=Microbacterium sp. P04 TaxID=3366947 RepID=UPI0037468659